MGESSSYKVSPGMLDLLKSFSTSKWSKVPKLIKVRMYYRTLIEARDALKFNVDAVDTLIRASLVNMLQFDAYLANALDKGNNLIAMNFAMQLVQMY